TRSAHAPRHPWVEAEELLEDALLLRRRDPQSLVRDLDPGFWAVGDPDPHAASLGRVLDRVVDEVDENLTEPGLVTAHRLHLWRCLQLELDARRRVRLDGSHDR